MRNDRKKGECHCRCHLATNIAVSMRLAACDGEPRSDGLFCKACGRPKGAEGRGLPPRRQRGAGGPSIFS